MRSRVQSPGTTVPGLSRRFSNNERLLKWTPRFRALLLLLPSLCLAGCGDGKSEVTGTVLVDKVPVEQGFISFIPMDGNSATEGAPILDGKYVAKTMPGMMKVLVQAPKVIGKRKLYNTPDSPVVPIRSGVLPPRYSDIDQSELRFEVKPGRNEKDFELSSK